MLSNRSASPSIPGGETCPHLGIAEDPQTCLAYPSAWNLCQHVRYPAAVRLEYQRTTCLAPFHTTCPVFKRARVVLLPAHLRGRHPGSGSKRVVILLLLLVLALGFGLWAASRRMSGMTLPTAADAPIETPQSDFLPVVSSAVTSESMDGFSVTPIKIQTAFAPAIATNTPGTAPPDSKHCGLELEGKLDLSRYEFILHRVASGESMNVLAENYGTSIQAIQAVNYFLPSPLWADLVIVIPIGSAELSGLPFFEPYFILDPVASLDAVAQQVSVTRSDLMKYNHLDEGCPAYAGWLLLPHPEKRTP